MATIAQALTAALGHHQAGRRAEAQRIYRQILAVDPNQPDALNLLAVLAYQAGNLDTAAQLLERAIVSGGSNAVLHSNLGMVRQAQGDFEGAIAACQRAVQLRPDFPEAHNNLGISLQSQGRLDEAAACYRRAIELTPAYFEAHNNLANVLHAQNNPREAIRHYREALRLQPDDAGALSNLGITLRDHGDPHEAVEYCRRAVETSPGKAEFHYKLGSVLRKLNRFDEAIACCRQAIALDPDDATAHHTLGSTLLDAGMFEEAQSCLERASQLRPDSADAFNDLGTAFYIQGLLDDAVAAYRQATRLKPEHARAWSNLGIALKEQGDIDAAIASHRRALEINPASCNAHSNLVYAMHLSPKYLAADIYEEQSRWYEQHARHLAESLRPHDNDRSPDRRLRIGYVSPDLREHVVGRFVLPLLESHDHERFEIFCYASVRLPDAMTARCRDHADAWRDVATLSDEQLADTIRHDQIDILVDLAMHTAGNRLLTFARKPAPVQVTYLAYAGATGLRTIDYRLTDPHLDPPESREKASFEEPLWLPETYWCYRAPPEAPAVGPLPALSAGHVTLGCLNGFGKVSAPALEAFASLLLAIPTAKLLLHAGEGSHRDRVRELFANRGISPDRLSFAGRMSKEAYFRLYNEIDIALDPFPYGGGTTTCDALWMGVPVVSLAGETSVSRAGLSILSNVGLPELVATDCAGYIEAARRLADDLPQLEHLRATLRDRMRVSPLCDAPRFTRHLEAAYRDIWRRWCGQQ